MADRNISYLGRHICSGVNFKICSRLRVYWNRSKKEKKKITWKEIHANHPCYAYNDVKMHSDFILLNPTLSIQIPLCCKML